MVGESENSIGFCFCYERRDKALYEELSKHLTVLSQQYQIASWHVGEIKAGMEWQEETTNHLKTADVILLLISADFLASENPLSVNMRQALERHAHNEAVVIPILLRPADVEGTFISKLQALPDDGVPVTRWGDRDEAFCNIVGGIRKMLKPLAKRQKPDLHSANNSTSEQASTPSNKRIVRDRVHDTIPPAFHFNAPLTSPDELYGRKRESRTLLDRISKDAATSIVGPRRIGKTWLMQYIKLLISKELGTRFLISYIDATSPRCDTIAGFVAFALEEMGIAGPLARAEPDLAHMEQVVRHLRKSGSVPVLCIDEFEGLIHEEAFDLCFFIKLRAIAQAGLVLVTASRHPLTEVVSSALKTSPFFNIFEKLTLEPFSLLEAQAFVDMKSKKAHFSDRECEHLLHYGQTGTQQWQPARLQLAGSLLQGDKMLAEQEDPQYYRPEDQDYWDDFKKRLEDRYQEMGL
jgi:hypothetical protein